MSDFEVPASFYNKHIEVRLAIPIPAPGGKGLTFPSIIGRLIDVVPGALLLQIDGKEVLMPKERVQEIVRASDVNLASVADLSRLKPMGSG